MCARVCGGVGRGGLRHKSDVACDINEEVAVLNDVAHEGAKEVRGQASLVCVGGHGCNNRKPCNPSHKQNGI